MSFRRDIKWVMRPSRIAVLVLAIVLIVFSLLSFNHHQTRAVINNANNYISSQLSGITDKFSGQSESTYEDEDDNEDGEDRSEKLDVYAANDFWGKVFQVFQDNKFSKDMEPLIKYTSKEEQIQSKTNSRELLLSKAKVFHKDKIRELHHAIMEQLPKEMPESVYVPGSRGLVTVGGDFYSWLAYINIMHLRKLGSELPVEVLIPDINDYKREQEFCEELLPKLNAKCILLPEILGVKTVKKWNFRSYQFKIFAIALSSFQHVVLVDSENMAARDPQLLFDMPVYKEKGMILWPDYWQRTISPEWYDIVEKKYSTTSKTKDGKFPLKEPVPLTEKEEENTRFNDLEGTIPDMSTESGQVMMNKKTHGDVILLTMYYNLFGPELYYKLFSLGALGEGDKDTFMTAAFACNKPWYQIHSMIKTFGYRHPDDRYEGMVMGQRNPQQDYEKYQELVKDGAKSTEDIKEFDKKFKEDDVEVFFMHCNIDKINPVAFMKKEDMYDSENNRMKVRFYNKFKHHDNSGNEVDFEKSRWEIVNQILCVDNTRFKFIKDADFDKVCPFVNNTIEWLKSN